MIDERLPAFLADLARRPFQYGETDCFMAAAEWIGICHGVNPAAAWRGTYSNAEECASVLKEHGEFPRAAARGLREFGLERTTNPLPGDVAVVRYCEAWYGAIRTPGHRWAIKCRDGVRATNDLRVVAAWKV
jgi:hypothetical protein